jgi:hypothetical protein
MSAATFKRAKIGHSSRAVAEVQSRDLAEDSGLIYIDESLILALPTFFLSTPTEQTLAAIQELESLTRNPAVCETILSLVPLPSVLLAVSPRQPPDCLPITCSILSKCMKIADSFRYFPEEATLRALESVLAQLSGSSDPTIICDYLRFATDVARLPVASVHFERFLPIILQLLDGDCLLSVIHRIFRFCCQLTYLNPRIALLFLKYGFLERAVKCMETVCECGKPFEVVCEFVGRLSVNENDAVDHLPPNFVDLCVRLVRSGNAAFFSLLEDISLNARLLRFFCDSQFTAALFEKIANGSFTVACRSAAFFAALMQEAPELMHGPVLEQGTFDPLLRLFEAESQVLTDQLLAGIATMVNFFIADRRFGDERPPLLTVLEKSPELMERLQEVIESGQPRLIVEAAELIIGIVGAEFHRFGIISAETDELRIKGCNQ